ncbi:iron-sulfur cluster assembly scaffold protein [Peribacillus frigoritolerans]|uniref:iron-sulfur cluster assembly scaffold protein n=1 Tax=Peribacillus frigoritolerans TaxID=450367 RepID=UPI00381AB724
MYNEIITEHFMNPRNIGELEHPSRVIKIGNAVCGDTFILHIAYNNNQEITDVRYKAYGCATSIATVSVFSEFIQNKCISDLSAVSETEIEALLGELEPNQMHCLDIMKELFKELGIPEGTNAC